MTTPPPQFSDHPVHSTPQSQGTASDAEYHSDTRTLNSQNIRNINRDLDSAHEVDLITMLKGFYILKHLNPDQIPEIGMIKTKVESLRSQAETDFNTTLHSAILYCNSKASSDIKNALHRYCGPLPEATRYQPLVDLLNKILCIHNDDPDVIFLVNDPGIVEVPGTLRKPDIILVSVKVLKTWLCQDGACDHYSFQECLTYIAKNGMPDIRRSWLDVLQFWELKAKLALLHRVTEISLTNFDAPSIMATTGTQGHLPGQPSGSSSVKRSSSTGPRAKRKQVPHEFTSESKRTRVQAGDYSPHSITPEVQCAYYAIERFRSSWQISHVTGVLLKDTGLEVYWYDSQGPIKTRQIDIIKHLPLLLVLVQVTCQQCFRHLSGLHESAKIPEGYKPVQDDGLGRRFQLVGRMTYGCYLTACTTAPSIQRTTRNSTVGRSAPIETASSAAQFFFKVSWPEDDRLKEADIIRMIPDKIRKLDERYHDFVTNHIPHVVEANTVSGSSTAIIRIALQLPSNGSRTQYWMVAARLESLINFLSNKDFERVYREIIRCHRLLWVAGIAHGDISFNNLMYNPANQKGVLNDFDLSTVMSHPSKHPVQTGHRRTGTKVFMALELLLSDGISGVIPRRYRHELESFAWVLLYAAVQARFKPSGVKFFQRLDKSTHAENLERKSGILGNLSCLGDYTDNDYRYAAPLLRTLKLWAELLINSNPTHDDVFGNESKKLKEITLPDSALITQIMKAWADHQEEDFSWVDAQVEG